MAGKGRKRRYKRVPLTYTVLFIVLAVLGGGVFFILWKGLFPPQKVRIDRLPEIVYPPVERPKPPPSVKPTPLKPRVAIVIDDLGYDLGRFRELLDLDVPITVAVLPYLKYSLRVAEQAHSKGWDVLLHLPMEPKDTERYDPGEHALFTHMSEDRVQSLVEENLGAVPFVKGVNNHMGSRFTEDEDLMRAVLEVIKKRDIFFLDSRTTAHSVAGRIAKQMGIKTADRDVFLDNRRDREYIRKQMEELVSIARRKGKAVAIGHPYPETISVLKDMIPELEREGIRVVKLSSLVE